MEKDFLQFIQEQVERSAPLDSVFGWSRDGEYVQRWAMDLDWIDHRTGRGRWVRIHVPETPTGIKPLVSDDQPYGWSGKINHDTAESAVWRAFEIITESEAADFMGRNLPQVTFEYFQDFEHHRLTVRYVSRRWVVVS